MQVALGSDEKTGLTDAVVHWLQQQGHSVQLVGPPAGESDQWAAVGRRVGELVANGEAEQGFLFCWTGTGASIAANKVPGIRAALCADAPTAAGARKWNDANVLVMSNRLVTAAVAAEILTAWFDASPDAAEADNITQLE